MTGLLQRPQPLGLMPFPAGLLLLPATADPRAGEALQVLLRGDTPGTLPDAWRWVGEALDGARDMAYQSLADDATPVAAYNRFVLHGRAEDLEGALNGEHPEVRTLACLAAFTMGSTDELPALDGLNEELLAHGLLIRAAAELERGAVPQAIETLEACARAAHASSPLLAAQALGQLAEVIGEGEPARRLAALRSAAALAGGSSAPMATELRLRHAIALHEGANDQRPRLVEAVKAYQEVLRHGVTIESAPELFALVQNNMGLAYIAMPMTTASDKLRLAVAVQSFREALKVYDRERYPEQWASTTLNMANALQYLPSGHREENLVEAVNAYEALLEVRNRALDPVGYARVQANQGNALAHLGMFGPALEKLHEAHKLLHWHGEGDAAQSILDQVERINARMAESAPGAA